MASNIQIRGNANAIATVIQLDMNGNVLLKDQSASFAITKERP